MSDVARIAAFFDLDKTLLTVNSGALWLQRERRLGRITRWQTLQGVFYLFAYKFRALDMESVTVKALETVRGEAEQTVREWTREWFRQEVTRFVAPGARQAIEHHRAQGHLLVLLTSSSLYASEAAVDHLGLDELICTRYEVQDGCFTGDLLRPACYGAGKVALAEQFAVTQNVDLSRSYFYTDSFSDLPMLERVGYPVVVHPDLRLRWVATRAGWPILDWRAE
jgi:HAD superfamily hydrolase (TIGR01490 family)